ncbi:MAG: tetratricopeptide repeat protein, partial [Phaeodactylibacter sp.]|nr:tetratricopeptide repeat protein [Phaeodactylibacter sp.]
PKLALPWNGLGNVYWDQKQYGQAIEAFQTAIQLDPKLALPWNGLGNVYREQKAYSKAIEAFQAAIQLDPKFILSWHGLGIVYDMLQEGSKAGRCFLRAEALGQEAFAHNYFVAFSKLETHPFFSYRIIQSYMPPEDYAQWSRYIRITLENATPLKAYITWQSLRAEWGGLPEEKWRLWLGLIHYFMGDPSVALQYLNQSQAGRSGLSLMAAYYQVQACYDFFEPDEPYLQPALKQAETYLGPKPSFWKRLLSNTPRLDTEGILQCYYAGQIFVFNQEPEKALICFERIEKEYLPAAYMALQMCHELQYQKRKEQKVKALIKREARQQQFTKGLAATELNLDDPQFWKPFFHVAQYFELTEAIATFRFAASRAKYRKPPYVQNPKAQKYFHQLWKIRSEDWRRINARILEELNYRAFDQLFEEELQPKVKTAPKLSEAMIEERLDQYENAGLRSAFEHLRAMAVKGKAEQGLGELIKAGQFEPEQYQLLNAYFYSNGQLEDYERILLDFYILLQAEMKDGQLSKVQLAGVKKSADAVITDSLSYAIGFGASLMVPGLPAVVTAVGGVLGGYAIKMGAGALTELFMGFIQEEEPAFESYADFKEQFEGYIGERRRVLGEEGFYERYPVDELYNSH